MNKPAMCLSLPTNGETLACSVSEPTPCGLILTPLEWASL